MPTFSLPFPPQYLTVLLQQKRDAPLPPAHNLHRLRQFRAKRGVSYVLSRIFGIKLKSREFSAQDSLTSELLRTL